MPRWSSQKGKAHACSNCGGEGSDPEEYRLCGRCGARDSFIDMSKSSQAYIQERYKGLVEEQTKPRSAMTEEERQAGITELWGKP